MNVLRYEALPMHVIFGAGAITELAAEADRLQLRKVLVLCTPEQRELGERVAGLLGDRAGGVFAGARMHVPTQAVREAESAFAEAGADGCVVAGGGSTIGLGKALALRHDLPIIALPTTYAGSEMTPIWGLTEAERKVTGRDRRVLPRSVVYDPELTYGLPVTVTVNSGLNAMAHAIEALYAPDSSPVVAAMAEQGLREFLWALPILKEQPAHLEARAGALRGAWLCGACLGATTMGLHHKLCHVLGGSLNLPHAETHAALLPHVVAFNLPFAPRAGEVLARAMGLSSPDEVAVKFRLLVDELSWGRTLSDLGMSHGDIDGIVDEVLRSPYSNPREPGRDDLIRILEASLGHPSRSR
ncbi:maleylacetate reductase [Nonomuraea monospora]|uniref:Maleylacetate reductase n=1 Tax=Nonomuraea monospora TaxID=568818 RepID=A0ABP5PX30_9ACTN